ncbi:Uncharacterised protein [Vibrio cholerae]|nr:Uncharacterised protein [Vibrio cholerae]
MLRLRCPPRMTKTAWPTLRLCCTSKISTLT